MKKILYITLIIALLSPISTLAADLSPEQEKAAKRIFVEFFSPFCPGRTLEDCPSSKASELREQIRDRLLKGGTKEEVEDYLISVYGESLSAMPRGGGFGQAAWLGPIIFLLSGLAIAIFWLKRASAAGDVPAKSIDAELQARIDKEIGA